MAAFRSIREHRLDERTLPRAFWRLLGAAGATNLADGIRAAALPLAAAARTNDAALVAGLATAQSLPYLVLTLFAGVVADRVDRKRALTVANVIQSAVFGLLAVIMTAGLTEIVILYGAAVVLGATETLRDVCASTMIPDIVRPGALQRANGKMVTAEFGANQLAGPALGAFLFTAAVGIPFMLSSGLVFVASLLVAGLPRTQSAPSGKTNESSRRPFTSLRRDISEGARFVFRCTWLRNALGLGALLTVTDSAWFSVLVLFARGEIGLGASGYGLMLTLGAAGGIIGGSLSDRIIIRTGLAGALRGSVAVAGVAELCLGFAGSIPGAVLALAVGNAAIAVWHTASASLRQSATPPHLLGRVNAVWRTAFMGVIPLGAMTGGFMAARFGLRAPFLTGGPALLVAALLVRRVTDSSKPAPRKKGA